MAIDVTLNIARSLEGYQRMSDQARNTPKPDFARSQPIQPSPYGAKFVASLQKATTLTAKERASMVDVAAIVDEMIENPVKQHKIYKELAGLAVYVGQMSNERVPDFRPLTALRYYGAARERAKNSESKGLSQIEQAVKQTVKQVLAERNSSVPAMQEFLANEPTAPQQIAATIGHAVEAVVDDMGADNSAPQKVTYA